MTLLAGGIMASTYTSSCSIFLLLTLRVRHASWRRSWAPSLTRENAVDAVVVVKRHRLPLPVLKGLLLLLVWGFDDLLVALTLTDDVKMGILEGLTECIEVVLISFVVWPLDRLGIHEVL